jgi:hypothetical protein
MRVDADLQALATILWDIVGEAHHNVPDVLKTSVSRITWR